MRRPWPARREGHRRRDQDHRIDRRRGEHERQRGRTCRSLDGPSPNSLRATGTDPHSQPGKAAPPTPAVESPYRPSAGAASEPAGPGDIRRDQTADHHAERQEGQRLDKHTAEHRGSFRQVRPTHHESHRAGEEGQPDQAREEELHRPGNRGRVRPAIVTDSSCQLFRRPRSPLVRSPRCNEAGHRWLVVAANYSRLEIPMTSVDNVAPLRIAAGYDARGSTRPTTRRMRS